MTDALYLSKEQEEQGKEWKRSSSCCCRWAAYGFHVHFVACLLCICVALCMRMLYNVYYEKQRRQQEKLPPEEQSCRREHPEQLRRPPTVAKSLMNYWFFDQQRTVLKSAAAKSQLKCNHRAYLMCVIATRPVPLHTVLHWSTRLQLRLRFRLHAHNSIYHCRSLCGCLYGALALHTQAQSHFILIAKRGDKKCALPVLKNWLLRK